MDGLQLDNAVLERHDHLARKGAPEMFDAAGLMAPVARLGQEEEVLVPLGATRPEHYNGIDQYQLMIEAFVRSLRDGTPFACPLEFSRGNQAMINAILAQSRP